MLGLESDEPALELQLLVSWTALKKASNLSDPMTSFVKWGKDNAISFPGLL